MTNEELIECIKAESEGKKIECRRWDLLAWEPKDHTVWNTMIFEYRIAPEPPKREGKWVRKEIVKDNGNFYCCKEFGLFIDRLPRIPGFGWIEYRDPRHPESENVSSMVQPYFNEKGDWTQSIWPGEDRDAYRPGIPVAAWFWEEE